MGMYPDEMRLARQAVSQLTERLSERNVGWTANPTTDDTGIDLHVTIFDGGKPTGVVFQLQVKGTEEVRTRADGSALKRLKRSDVLDWYNTAGAVFVVLWDVLNRRGWWLLVDDLVGEMDACKPNWSNHQWITASLAPADNFEEAGLTRMRDRAVRKLLPIAYRGGQLRLDLSFDTNDAAGAEAHAQFRDYLERGTAVTLAADHVARLRLPAPIHDMVGMDRLQIQEVRLAVMPLTNARAFGLRYRSAEGNTFAIMGLPVTRVRAGTAQTEWRYDEGSVPICLCVESDRSRSTLTIQMSLRTSACSVQRADEVASFFNAVASGGRVELVDCDTMDLLAAETVPRQPFTLDPDYLQILQMAAQVALRLALPLRLPEGWAVTEEEEWSLRLVDQVVRSGCFELPVAGCSLSVSVDSTAGSEPRRGAPASGVLPFGLGAVRLFGCDTELGPSVIEWHGIVAAVEPTHDPNGATPCLLKLRIQPTRLWARFVNWSPGRCDDQ